MYRNCERNSLVEVLRGENVFSFFKKKTTNFGYWPFFFNFMQIFIGALATEKKIIIRYFTDLSTTDSTSTYFTAAGHQQLFLKVIC